MYSFGSGVLLGTRTDIPNATPVNFGLVQEVTIDETATIKELTGQFQRPVAIARGSIKTTGKAKVARISGLAFSSLYYGFTPVQGQVATAFAEADTIAATTPFIVTVANSATFVDDAGVLRNDRAAAHKCRVGPSSRAIFLRSGRLHLQFIRRWQGRPCELHLYNHCHRSKIHGVESIARHDPNI
jgi:hypothetical protein